MGINEAMDALVKQKQDACEHSEQNITRFPDGVFCICGLRMR